MSFNKEQEEYMADLAKVPTNERCWCGWHRLSECPRCKHGLTLEQKMAEWCQSCRSAPHEPGGRVVHRIGCEAELERLEKMPRGAS
jgi:hypothetical protein